MRYRHTMTLFGVCLPICLILRALQYIFTIDGATGFIKQQYSSISVIITLIIFAGVFSVGLIGYATDSVVYEKKNSNYALMVGSFLAGLSFIYDTATSFLNFNVIAWYDIFVIILGLMCAVVFIAYGVRFLYSYNFPTMSFIVPVFYYIIKLISIFVSTSELALVTENIFMIITNSTLLIFIYEFSKVENNIDEIVKSKKLFAWGIISAMLCFTQSVPRILVYNASLSQKDMSSALLNAIMGVFILSYIMSSFKDKNAYKTAHVAKHLAE